MPARTASGASAAGFKKNVKQILTLERERVSGGDGFLSAAQTAAKARGEPIEPQKKKKKENPVGRTKVLSGAAAQRARANANRSGFNTPLTIDDESVMSGTVTPAEDEDDKMEIDGLGDEVIHREIITCGWQVEELGLTRQTTRRPLRHRCCQRRSTATSPACRRHTPTRAPSCGTRASRCGALSAIS